MRLNLFLGCPLLLLALTVTDALAAELPTQSIGTNTAEHLIARMYVLSDSTTNSLLDLHRAAVKALRHKYHSFEAYTATADQWSLPRVRIDHRSKDKYVAFTYGTGKMGAEAWLVYFSQKGKISSVNEGMSGELGYGLRPLR